MYIRYDNISNSSSLSRRSRRNCSDCICCSTSSVVVAESPKLMLLSLVNVLGRRGTISSDGTRGSIGGRFWGSILFNSNKNRSSSFSFCKRCSSHSRSRDLSISPVICSPRKSSSSGGVPADSGSSPPKSLRIDRSSLEAFATTRETEISVFSCSRRAADSDSMSAVSYWRIVDNSCSCTSC